MVIHKSCDGATCLCMILYSPAVKSVSVVTSLVRRTDGEGIGCCCSADVTGWKQFARRLVSHAQVLDSEWRSQHFNLKAQ